MATLPDRCIPHGLSAEMKIPISKNWFGEEELEAIQQPLRDGWVTQGPRVEQFEREFSGYTTAAHSVACASATAGLHIAVQAMNPKAGDEVLVPGFTWVATANVVELAGAKPVFCDIELDSFNLCLDSLRERVTSHTVGILPVHLFGLCADLDPVLELAKEQGLWVIEDAACALGSFYKGRHAGTSGNAGCFSFHPRKSISTGEGGMITTEDPELDRRFRGLRNHGLVPSEDSTAGAYSIAGFNYRMTDIQGALGVAQMERLEFLLAERQRCARYYDWALEDVSWLSLPSGPEEMIHSYQSYVTTYQPEAPTLANVETLHRERNSLMQHLADSGISTRPGTHAPPHLEHYREKYRIRKQDVPNAWIADQLTIALPLFPGITEDELSYVCEHIKRFSPTS